MMQMYIAVVNYMQFLFHCCLLGLCAQLADAFNILNMCAHIASNTIPTQYNSVRFRIFTLQLRTYRYDAQINILSFSIPALEL